MLEYYMDVENDRFIFAIFSVDDKFPARMKKIMASAGGHDIDLSDDEIFDELPEFTKNTVIFSSNTIDEDLISAIIEKGICVYLIP